MSEATSGIDPQRFDPYDPFVRDHYYEIIERMRSTCPAARSEVFERAIFFSRYDDVMTILKEDQVFGARGGGLLPIRPPTLGLAELDPPEHTNVRHPLLPFFTAEAVGKHLPVVRDTMNGLIDRLIEVGHCDLMHQFAMQFPAAIFFKVFLGVEDPEELEQCKRWSADVSYKGGTPEGAEAWAALEAWAQRYVAMRRASPDRGDVVDALLSATIGGKPISDEYIIHNVRLLVLGGIGSTANSTGNGLHQMAGDEAVREAVRSRLPDLSRVVEEFLRFEPHNTANVRIVRQPTTLCGTALEPGDYAVWLLAGANRDPDRFSCPNTLNLDRERNNHVTFGAGRHLCLGRNLARLELATAYELVLERMADFRLADGADVTYRQGVARGLERLPVEFTPGRRVGSPRPDHANTGV